jgi:hypothetical protein
MGNPRSCGGLIRYATGRNLIHPQKGNYTLKTSDEAELDSYIFVRSYQETEKEKHGSILKCLDANDRNWRERDIIMMSSHISQRDTSDIDEMIEVAHANGFDVIAVSVLRNAGELRQHRNGAWKSKNWDERWVIWNTSRRNNNLPAVLDGFGVNLFLKIATAALE